MTANIEWQTRRRLDQIENLLQDIGDLFVPDAKITLLVRLPGDDEADVVMTIDTWPEVEKLIKRAKKREEIKP